MALCQAENELSARFKGRDGRQVRQARLLTDPDLGVVLSPLVTNSSLAEVLRAESVAHINLEGMPWITAQSMALIPKICGQQLLSINLSENTEVCDDLLLEFSKACFGLTRLELRSCPNVTIVGMSTFLSRLPNLRNLDLSRNPDFLSLPQKSSDEDLIELYKRSVPPLLQERARIRTRQDTRNVDLELSNERAAFAMHLSESALENLNLSEIDGVDDKLMEQIFEPEAPITESLRRLRLGDTLLTSAGVETFAKVCPNLQEVDLSLSTSIDSAGIVALAENCRQLTSLDLSGLHLVNDEAILNLVVDLGTSLTDLALSGCTGLGDETLDNICYRATAMERLDLTGCINLPKTDFLKLATGKATRLRQVKISACWQVEPGDVTDLQRLAKTQRPGLKIVRCKGKAVGDPIISGIVPNWRPLPVSAQLKTIAKDGSKARKK